MRETTKRSSLRGARTSLALIDLVLETYGNPDSISRQTSGFELIKRIRRDLPDIRIQAMSHFYNVEQLSLDAGAHGFVHKDKIAVMREAIVRVARRQRPAERTRPSTPCLTVFVRTHQIQLPADKEEHPIRKLEPRRSATRRNGSTGP